MSEVLCIPVLVQFLHLDYVAHRNDDRVARTILRRKVVFLVGYWAPRARRSENEAPPMPWYLLCGLGLFEQHSYFEVDVGRSDH